MMDDLISRQAAIDEIEYELEMINSALDSLTLDFNARERLQQRRGEAREILNSIQQLPSAQPEPKWISCEKRLPTQEGEYLVCDHNERVFIAKFWTAFGEWGDKDIIAWQKTPEPYRKETEEV